MAVRSPSARRAGSLAPIAAAVAVTLLVLAALANRYTELLWFRQVGSSSGASFSRVFTTVLLTKVALFFAYGAVMATILGVNIWVAHRIRPPFRPMSLEQQNLDRYRLAVEPHTKGILGVLMVLFAIVAGTGGAGHWQAWQMWLNKVPFGVTEPQFGKDISFFAFDYPLYRLVVGFIFSAFVFATLLSAATHYLFGGVRLQTPGDKVIPAARAHLSVLLGILAALKAVLYYLDRYGLAFSPSGSVTGASYTDVNARLPALTVLIFAAALCSVLFIANLRSRGWLLPGVAVGLLLLMSLVAGFAYPTIVQRVKVRPNELRYEKQYIQRNIDATQRAFGLAGMELIPYKGTAPLTGEQINDENEGAGGARLLDPNMLTPTFEQLRQQRNYYGFSDDGLDVDRYQGRDYVVAVREIDQDDLDANQRNWLRERLIYTHGFGIVAAPADKVTAEGQPVFEPDDSVPFTLTQPRVYFGELAPDYSVVGDAGTREVDRPAGDGADQQAFTYDGKGGVSLAGINRLLYAVHFREPNLLISSAVTGNSKIMYHRSPRDRVAKVAPFLELDRDPYPAVIGGRITWIVDGYTTSAGYPYAQRVSFGRATEDTTAAGRRSALDSSVNYIRNSVKATVDAYDGTVTLYAWDEADPVLRTWRKVFPGIVKDKAAISDELASHIRYPEDLFKVQRDLVRRYHVRDAETFFNERDVWAVPDDPTAQSRKIAAGPQPPYYQLVKLPGQDNVTFNLTSALTPRGDNVKTMAGYLYASSGPDDYGKLRLLELPKESQVQGPPQVANSFSTFPEASGELSLLDQRGSEVVYGNLLTIPVRDSVVHVQPVYVQAEAGAKFPLLQRVFVSYLGRVGYAPTLSLALAEALQEPAGTPPGGAGQPAPSPAPGVTPAPSASPAPTVRPPAGDTLQRAIGDAVAAQQAAEAALAKSPPDWAAYGQAQQRLKAALDRVKNLSGTPAAGSAATPSPSPAR